jgi:hypothetical protein
MPREAVSTPICDFCNSKNVEWRYPADSFAVEEIKYISQQDWAACESCANLIESYDLRTLARRSPGYKDLLKAVNEDLAVMIVVEFHLQFMIHRTGPRIRVRDSLV